MAGVMYISGSPDLSAHISGTNEFSTATEIQLPVVIENTGLYELKINLSSLADRDELPNTAKFLTVVLLPGDAPVIIKSDPQMLDDLPGSSSVTQVFTTRINARAPSGTYHLVLMINYSYLYSTDQSGFDTMEYVYKNENMTINLPIKIKPDIAIDVLSAEPEHLNAGTTGYLNLKIKNTGSEGGSKSIVKIIRNGNSPIVPIDSSVYIGDFPAGSTVACRYKVSVSENAEKQTYPIDVIVVYQNAEGDTVTSRSDTAGIAIGGKTDFEIISAPAEMHPGNNKIITVAYKNTGDTTVYSAQARISAVDPFTCNEDIAYLGTLNPGESKNVSYSMSVDRSATIKQYGIDSEIRYRDALDNTYISDTMKVKVDVMAPNGAAIILTNPIYLSIIASAIIGIAYLIYHYRRKQ